MDNDVQEILASGEYCVSNESTFTTTTFVPIDQVNEHQTESRNESETESRKESRTEPQYESQINTPRKKRKLDSKKSLKDIGVDLLEAYKAKTKKEKDDLQGNVFNCVKPIFFKPGFIERYIPPIHNAKKIRCPNSLGSEKMGVEVVYVKTFRLL